MTHRMANVFEKIGLGVFFVLLVYMPFHVLLSNWLGASLGVLEVIKAVKEPVMLVGLSLLALARKSELFKLTENNRLLVWLLVAYAGLSVTLLVVRSNSWEAEVLSLVYNTRFLLFFVYGALIYKVLGKDARIMTVRYALVAGIAVALLGVMQVLFLPDDSLAWFGYSRETGTSPVFYISDVTKDTERAFSTLKDPNSLGSYLIIIIFLLIGGAKVRYRKKVLVSGILLLCLYLTYSRSAWLGLAAAFVAFLFLYSTFIQKIAVNRKKIFLAGSVFLVAFVAIIALVRGTYIYNNLILHEIEGKEINSNSNRLIAYRHSVDQIVRNPLGYGMAAAGPVSYKNALGGPAIPENYYLQLALEVGIVGLGLFLCIVGVVAWRLYKNSTAGDLVAAALLAGLVGVSVACMFNHIWVSEAVAYTWWGLAGVIAFSRPRPQKSASEKS